MTRDNRGPGSPSRRRQWAFRPSSEGLEDRQLLAAIDLANIQTSPLGVEMLGKLANNGAGYTVTDVGDVTGSGFDDFAVAVTGNTAPNGNPNNAAESAVYLIFGSTSVSSTTVQDFLKLATTTPGPSQRAGDLGTLGQLNQVNPTVAQNVPPVPIIPGFDFAGITLVAGLDAATGLGKTPSLGYSVAALGNISGQTNGLDSFAIGAPGANGGAGKVFVVFGDTRIAGLTGANATVNLLNATGGTAAPASFNLLSFSIPTGRPGFSASNQVGYAVAGIGNYLNFSTSVKDLAIGVPGYNNNAGAVFAISGSGLNQFASGTDVDLSTIGLAGGVGIQYTGETAGDRTGATVATAGDFDGFRTAAGIEVDDLLIGAPGVNGGSGRTYLIYGNQTTLANSTLGSTFALNVGDIGVLPTTVNGVPTTPLDGAIFNGSIVGAQVGFAIAPAGDFNGDGAGDFIVGAPGVGNGFATIVYGRQKTTTVPRIIGQYNLTPSATGILTGFNPTPTGLAAPPFPNSLSFIGNNVLGLGGAQAGYSVSYVGDINQTGVNGVLIGAPGYANGSGTAYVIPGNYNLVGQKQLDQTTIDPQIAGTQLTVSNSNGSAAALGTSVSGRPFFVAKRSGNLTVDSDSIPDVIVGAPGYSLTDPQNGGVARSKDGAGFYVSGANLGVTIPNTAIITKAGIGTNNPNGSPFTIATTPNNLTIFIYSTPAANGLPAFAPFTDINQASIVINGVAFPTLTNFTQVPDSNGDGVPDASFTINRSLLGLQPSASPITFVVRGRTNSTPPNIFVAVAQVIVSGGGGSTGTTTGTASFTPTAASLLQPPIFTGDLAGQSFPPVSSLEHLSSYAPLPVTIAYQQFRPAPGFLAREEVAHHPSQKSGSHQAPHGTILNVYAIGHSENRYAKVNTLPKKIFTRDPFKHGKTLTFTHKVKVIPTSSQTERLTSA